MKMLVVDELGSVLRDIAGMLADKGHEVLKATGCSDADSLWQDADCIVLDLNMSTEGLDPREYQETRIGLFTGWIWLRRHVLPQKPEMASRSIVYSAYIDELEREFRSHGKPEECKDVCLIRKGDRGAAERLLRRVAEIENTIGGNRT